MRKPYPIIMCAVMPVNISENTLYSPIIYYNLGIVSARGY